MDHKPPLTIALAGVQILLHMQQHSAAAFRVLVSKFGLVPGAVLEGDWLRLVTAPFIHGGDLHLYYNMSSLLWKGSVLEPLLGSRAFGLVVAELTLTSGLIYALLVSLLSHAVPVAPVQALLALPAVGFSGVLFGLKAVATADAAGRSVFQGWEMPTRHLAWAELFLCQLLVPEASFLGHAAGILAGILHLRVTRPLLRAGGFWTARKAPRTHGRGTWGADSAGRSSERRSDRMPEGRRDSFPPAPRSPLGLLPALGLYALLCALWVFNPGSALRARQPGARVWDFFLGSLAARKVPGGFFKGGGRTAYDLGLLGAWVELPAPLVRVGLDFSAPLMRLSLALSRAFSTFSWLVRMGGPPVLTWVGGAAGAAIRGLSPAASCVGAGVLAGHLLWKALPPAAQRRWLVLAPGSNVEGPRASLLPRPLRRSLRLVTASLSHERPWHALTSAALGAWLTQAVAARTSGPTALLVFFGACALEHGLAALLADRGPASGSARGPSGADPGVAALLGAALSWQAADVAAPWATGRGSRLDEQLRVYGGLPPLWAALGRMLRALPKWYRLSDAPSPLAAMALGGMAAGLGGESDRPSYARAGGEEPFCRSTTIPQDELPHIDWDNLAPGALANLPPLAGMPDVSAMLPLIAEGRMPDDLDLGPAPTLPVMSDIFFSPVLLACLWIALRRCLVPVAWSPQKGAYSAPALWRWARALWRRGAAGEGSAPSRARPGPSLPRRLFDWALARTARALVSAALAPLAAALAWPRAVLWALALLRRRWATLCLLGGLAWLALADVGLALAADTKWGDSPAVPVVRLAVIAGAAAALAASQAARLVAGVRQARAEA